ncbi:MAG: hypothetical protein M1824_003573 [Vezdaea acicularis]|nr:MAG: hypothetical protein M1824_003573 [Vezdaea acicularis]
MKSTSAALSLSALLFSTLALAVPYPQHQNYNNYAGFKRDLYVTTVTDWVVETVDITSTVYVSPSDKPAAPAAPPPASTTTTSSSSSSAAAFFQAPPSSSTTVSTTSTTPPPATTPAVQAVVPTTSAAAAPPPPPPSSTSAAPPPPPPSSSAPAPAAPAVSTTSTSGGGSGGTPNKGDMTYYSAGLGSCGTTSADTDHIVALAHGLMDTKATGNPNSNGFCGKTITISYKGKTATATVVDTCMGCDGMSIDVSPAVAEALDPGYLTDGRVEVEWWFN